MTDDLPGMPKEVATAVNAVMKATKRIEKGDFNQHGKFKFTSVDDFFDAVRPLMAEAGLIISSDEDHFEIIPGADDKSWLLMRFAFTLSHASGVIWDRPQRRSIMVLASMGAQAFGAAQSYAEKQFLRSLFKMSTGDADADSHEQSDLPKARPYESGLQRKSSAQAKRDGDHETIIQELAACQSEAGLDNWFARFDERTANLPISWLDPLRDEVEKRRNALLDLVAERV